MGRTLRISIIASSLFARSSSEVLPRKPERPESKEPMLSALRAAAADGLSKFTAGTEG